MPYTGPALGVRPSFEPRHGKVRRGRFAELALASPDRMDLMPGQASFAEAAGLVIGGGTAHEGLVDRGRLRPGETVPITAAAGGVGSAAVQIAAAMGARPLAVASRANHHYLRGLGASEAFDYHAGDWVRRCVPSCPAALTCCWTPPGGRPAIKRLVRSATAG